MDHEGHTFEFLGLYTQEIINYIFFFSFFCKKQKTKQTNKKQGRVHGYRYQSRVRVGRGSDEIGQSGR